MLYTDCVCCKKKILYYTGNFIIDFFHGREVNPRIGNFHIKYFVAVNMFCIGLILVNLSMLTHDYLRNGGLNIPAMMVGGFQGLYVLTYLFNEVKSHLLRKSISIVHLFKGSMPHTKFVEEGACVATRANLFFLPKVTLVEKIHIDSTFKWHTKLAGEEACVVNMNKSFSSFIAGDDDGIEPRQH